MLVGNPPEPFFVHESLVRKSAPFFENAMHGPWKERDERTVRLKDEKPAAFALYLEWLYRGPVIPTMDWEDEDLPGDNRFELLCSAYIMGDMLRNHSFMDAVLDSMHAQTKIQDQGRVQYLPGPEVVRSLYESSLESSGMAKYLRDLYIREGNIKCLQDSTEPLPRAFLQDIVIEFWKFRDEEDRIPASLKNLCPYHSSHGLDKTCNQSNKPTNGKRKRS